MRRGLEFVNKTDAENALDRYEQLPEPRAYTIALVGNRWRLEFGASVFEIQPATGVWEPPSTASSKMPAGAA